MTCPLYVEPFAGAAAVALQLLGGAGCHPPVSWMGGKRRLAPVILSRLGLAPGLGAGRVVLCDAGPWGWVWPALLDPVVSAQVAATLHGWAGEPIQALWFRLRDEGPRTDPAEAVAQWLLLQARSASGAPVFWADAESRTLRPELDAATRLWTWSPAPRLMQGSGEGRRPQPAGQRGGILEKGRRPGRGRELAGACHANATLLQGDRRPDRYYPAWQNKTPALLASDGRGVTREAGIKGDKKTDGRVGGLVRIETLAERVESLALALRGAPVQVVAGRAEDLPARLPHNLCDAVVYLDPPYRGCTGYGWDVERRDLVAMAREYVRRGAVVGISEAAGLVEELGPGWRQEDITLPAGKKQEWLTWYRPAVQLRLL